MHKTKLTNLVIILLLLTGLIGSNAPTTVAAAQSLHPALAEAASQNPDQMVRVIVQKLAGDSDAEQKVAQLGGRVLQDLGIINAFSAEMKAQAAAELARSGSVRWVSLDAPTRSVNLVTETVADNFDVRTYSNQDGSQDWLVNWVEINDDNRADGGKVKIDKSMLRIEDKNRGLQRTVNLQNATSAILTFQFRRESMDKTTKYVDLQISMDGGVTWSLLNRIAGPANDSTLSPASYDISAYISNNVTIRFLTSAGMGGRLWVDDLMIEYQLDSGPGDAPPPPTADPEFIVKDDFGSGNYSGNAGNVNWSSSWVESDPASTVQDPIAGYVQILNGELRLNNQNYDNTKPYLARMLDLSGGVAFATLSFDFRTSSQVTSADVIEVDISSDGGKNYYILDLIMDLNGAKTGSRSYDITRYASHETMVRMRVGNNYGLTDHYFYVDNLQVAYSMDPNPPGATDYKTLGDDFQAYPSTFSNNSGTQSWSSPWQEIGEDDGPTAGDIKIFNMSGGIRGVNLWTDRLSGQAWTPVKGIWRTADLSGATSAELRFIYQRSTMEDGDYMTVDVSKDGGATWSETKRIYGKSLLGIDPGWHAVYVDISSFISSNVAVRFVTNFQNNDYYDSIYLDNIQIVFNDPVTLAQPNTYLQTLNVQPVWDMGINGAGVTIAVVDSGVALDSDFSSTPGQLTADRVLLQLGFNQAAETVVDAYGHGTHVAGIIAGNGTKSEGYYKGIAPGANLISLRVSDDYGMSYESDVVAALQWIYNNKSNYNIRVVNLSLNSTTEASYHNSPLNAAVEILWFNGVVVVASAGNTGGGTFNTADAAPANDPFIITVGASDEQYTASRADDLWASFSANGTTMDGHAKPDIVAPGRNIISVLASSSWWRNDYPDRFLEGGYFRIGGTSMSAPMVTGAVALLLQDEPNLNPDQVKYRLLNGAGVIIGKLGDDTNHAYPYLDVYAAVTGTTTGSANQGIMPSLMLASGEDAIDFASVGWNSVGWNSVGWNSVGWNSVGWNSVGWNSVGWNSVGWNSTYWGE